MPCSIQVLIDMDIFSEIFSGSPHSVLSGFPIPYQSIFGLVLIGLTKLTSDVKAITSCFVCYSNFLITVYRGFGSLKLYLNVTYQTSMIKSVKTCFSQHFLMIILVAMLLS